MRIVVNGSELRLVDPDVFAAFDVLTTQGPGAVVDALGEHGAACAEANHVFIAMAAIRSLAGAAVDDSWERQFQGMCGYAESNGWLNDAGDMIKAHLTTD